MPVDTRLLYGVMGAMGGLSGVLASAGCGGAGCGSCMGCVGTGALLIVTALLKDKPKRPAEASAGEAKTPLSPGRSAEEG